MSSGSESSSDSESEDDPGLLPVTSAAPPAHRAVMRNVARELQSAVGVNRRRTRTHRTAEAKLSHMAHLQHPRFQNWAEAAADKQQVLPVPDALLVPAPGMRGLPAPALPVPRMVRSISAQAASCAPPSPVRRVCTPSGTTTTFICFPEAGQSAAPRPRTTTGDWEAERGQQLSNATKLRANDQCMPLLKKTFEARMALRVGGVRGEQVTQHAKIFDAIYGQTQEVLEGRLCFVPPKRRHSVTVGQVCRLLRSRSETLETERRESAFCGEVSSSPTDATPRTHPALLSPGKQSSAGGSPRSSIGSPSSRRPPALPSLPDVPPFTFPPGRYETVLRLSGDDSNSVDLVRECATGQERVRKTVSTGGLPRETAELLRGEAWALGTLDHPGVVRLHEHTEDREGERFVLILEYLPGGDCEGFLKESGGAMNEAIVARLTRQLLTALSYCHAQGIVHRDVKPGNLCLLPAPSGRGVDCKLIDFGFASCGGGVALRDFLGTLPYMAPELFLGYPPTYGAKADVWSAGVLAFELLVGAPPFGRSEDHGGSFGRVSAAIRSFARRGSPEADLEKAAPRWGHMSAEARDFLLSVLCADPAERPTATVATDHPWLQGRDCPPSLGGG